MQHTNRVLRSACLVAVLLVVAVGSVGAQTIRKYVTPDGRTIYSDVPVPGAREVGEVAPPRQVDPESRRRAQESAQSGAERAQELSQQRAESQEQRERIRAAERQLEEARARLANGKEPLPSERIGTAGGASRLNEAYFERQRANQQAVEEAQKRLDEIRAER